MTPAERAGSLNTAARLVRAVARKLNADSHVCQSCGLRVKEVWIEAEAREQLEAIERKLERLARLLSRQGEEKSHEGHSI